MWRCAKCQEESEDHFDACWSCGAARGATAAAGTASGVPATPPKVPDSVARERTQLYAARYKSARDVVRFVGVASSLTKAIGFLLGLGCLIGALMTNPSGGSLIIGTGMAFAIIVLFWALGALLAAIAEILRAMLDTAIHTSPLLTRAEVERLITTG